MTRTVIIAAMAGELKPLVRGWEHEHRGTVDLWRWRFDAGEWIAACGGAGADAGTRAFAEAESYGPISSAISVGWAGALRADLELGSVYKVSEVVDAVTGERFRADCWSKEQVAVSSPKVADEREKRRLAATYHADLVDMEGATVARLAAMRGIPFCCLKGVSDGLTARLPDFNRFIAATGEMQLARFVLFAALRPWYWPGMIRMGENSKKAARAIAGSVLDILDIQGEIRKRNGYPGTR